jgi:uncharacterized DUF497 family protein
LVSVEFDPKKDAANLRKHGVSLSEGDGVLHTPSGEDVRIISVRRADPKERRNDEKGV